MSARRAVGIGALLAAVLALACTPTASPNPPTASPTRGAVRYATVESSVQPPGSVRVEMSNYAFQPADIPVAPGKVVLYLVNSSNIAHVLTLRNPAASLLAVVAASESVEAGRSAVLTMENLPAATYRMNCPIGPHSDLGMVGTLTVR